ncbi:siphovirus Gp157 family protein [Brevibacillus sp. NRS-1366]|uniref:siphovirus Gp157 family protein n=1 Tax=Brevibacillus sp. NRS-1366 TaxID=3233899 RepID=UPI003D1E5ACA
MNLYELSQAYISILDMLEEDDSLKETLDVLNDAIEVKAENLIKYMKNIEAESKALKEESKRLTEKAKSLENRHDRLKQYLEDSLKQANIKKLKAGLFDVRLQNNPPSVVIHNEKAVPEEFKIPQEPKIDKKGLLEALKAGKDFGDSIQIHQGESIRIK